MAIFGTDPLTHARKHAQFPGTLRGINAVAFKGSCREATMCWLPGAKNTRQDPLKIYSRNIASKPNWNRFMGVPHNFKEKKGIQSRLANREVIVHSGPCGPIGASVEAAIAEGTNTI